MLNNATRTLVIATSNPGKLREIEAILSGQPVSLCRPVDLLGYMPDIVEDGARFEDNALIKARAVAMLTGQWTLADDSGLEVDALAGQPGVRSARYAGERATDADNNRALLQALTALGVTRSPGRFRCAMALVAPDGALLAQSNGVCEGEIQLEARGTQGFGYDPLFVVTELGSRTMAELSADEKNAVSHRARALSSLLPKVTELVGGSNT
jgi:XTP/dITP diphosphohydrolase